MTVPKMSAELRKLVDILRTDDFEKTIPYLYLDSVGILTVGIGHNIQAHPFPSLQSMSFVVARLERHKTSDGDKGLAITKNPIVGRAATPEEIQNDIDFLKRHGGLKKYSPQNIARYTTLELTTFQINSLFDADLNEAFRICRDEFTLAAFLEFPMTCQAALIDIAFNCGGFDTFRRHFIPAIKSLGAYAEKSREYCWSTAAEHSRRGQVGLKRNAVVRNWLLTGARLSAVNSKVTQ